jgi:hypothetical protein
MSLSIFAAVLLAAPVGAVPTFKVSNYGGGHQIWFEAEDSDERSPDTAQYSPVVDQAGAFGKAVSRTGDAGGRIMWTFDISAAGGKGGTWYFLGRVLNPNNRSDYLLVEGDPGDADIPSTPPFPGGNEVAPFLNADDQIFEQTVASWDWVRTNHSNGHTKQLQDGKNTMYIFRREGQNATVFWDVFVWADDPDYRPTDDDYRNAQVYRPGKAADASPTGTDVPLDSVLSWTAGAFAGKHDVYFGTDEAAVSQGTTTADPAGVYKGRLDGTTYTPSLAFGQTYYWRIDEVNKTPDNALFTGNVWSFTTEPYAYPIKPVAATASSAQADMGPEKTIDGSGMAGDLHGTDGKTMWLSAGTLPNWIQYEFDRVYKLGSLQVWNSNQMVESFVGFGARKVTIETSPEGTTWTAVADVPEFAQGLAAPDYAANTTVNLGGVEAKYVKLTIETTWGGLAPQAGLAEVRFSHVPVQARAPQPASAAKEIGVDASLNWRPGRQAASHTVYFGTDAQAVANGTAPAQTVTGHSYSPGSLNYGTTYYWRVDELNAVTYPGGVWSFTTQEYAVVEDFESYNDVEPTRLFDAWVDGFGKEAQNGAVAGLTTAVNGTFCDTTVFHGGRASMPFAYDNTAAPLSEATLTLAPAQDWTARGVKSLALWFQGAADNTGKLYAKINNTKVSYPGAAGDLARAGWMLWSIDLSTVAGGVSKVTKLTIGVEGAGAKGTLRVDDIQLSTTVVVPITQPVITAVVRANGQAGTRTDASPLKAYTESTAPVPTGLYGLMDGAFVFSDRPYPWSNTPAELVGAEYVLTINNDKTTGETDVTYTVTLGRAATVFLTCDDRFADQQATVDHVVAAFAKPGQFKDTGLTLYIQENATTDRPVSVFAADLAAGTYVFGSQEGNNFYVIGVLPK